MTDYNKIAVDFCCYIQHPYNEKEKAKIDFIISKSYIKFYFYFNYENSIETTAIIDELNCGIKAFNLKNMSDFYMKLDTVQNCKNFDLCRSFFSFNKLEKFFR